jgi:hypothetical protein
MVAIGACAKKTPAAMAARHPNARSIDVHLASAYEGNTIIQAGWTTVCKARLKSSVSTLD